MLKHFVNRVVDIVGGRTLQSGWARRGRSMENGVAEAKGERGAPGTCPQVFSILSRLERLLPLVDGADGEHIRVGTWRRTPSSRRGRPGRHLTESFARSLGFDVGRIDVTRRPRHSDPDRSVSQMHNHRLRYSTMQRMAGPGGLRSSLHSG